MRYYETLYIVHPDYEDDRLEKIKQEVHKQTEKSGAKIINSHIWGKRKLAYTIKKQKYGTYMLMHFGTDKPAISEFHNWMEQNEKILAYLTVRLEKEPSSRNGQKAFILSEEVAENLQSI